MTNPSVLPPGMSRNIHRRTEVAMEQFCRRVLGRELNEASEDTIFAVNGAESTTPPYVAYVGYLRANDGSLFRIYLKVYSHVWCDIHGELEFDTLDALYAYQLMQRGGVLD